MKKNIESKLRQLPASAGVYIFKDANKKVIYVGKASSLRKRVRSYFQKGNLGAKINNLVDKIENIDYILTESEAEALLYEAQLIKEYQPKYNVSYKDDKAYPLLKLTINEKYPCLSIVRRKRKDNALYFGPYTDAKLLRKALRFLRKIFPLRPCRKMPKYPCLYYHLGLCLAPCAKKTTIKEYGEVAEELVLFLKGKHGELIEKMTKRMNALAKKQQYEKAAKLKTQIQSLSKLILKDSAAVSEDHLQDIKAVLDLKKIPAVIEGFDVSNIFGYHSVGAMVSFKNGKPDKNNFRRFKIKSTESINDYKMTAEIIRRRYKRLKEEKKRLPDLIIIDGGQGHLNLAKQTIKKLGLDIAIISIAKEKELIYLPHKKRPLNLPPNSKTLHLVQRIRDEAHRFAISYHHVLRNKMTKKSILKEIRGIGPKRYKNLINKFKNIDNIKQASWKELASVESMDKKSAKNIKQYFKKM